VVLVDTLQQSREDAELSEQEARTATMPLVPSTSSSIVADGPFSAKPAKAALAEDFEIDRLLPIVAGTAQIPNRRNLRLNLRA